MGNPVVHFEIIGQNASNLRSFYRDAFDWQIEAPIAGSPVDYSIVQPDGDSGIRGGIGQCPDGSYSGHMRFYIGVPDAAAALRKVQSLGGTLVQGPEQVPGGPIIGTFRDPEDHVVGIVRIP
jgi:uncharacterized protein